MTYKFPDRIVCGIYCSTCKITNKKYVGLSKNIKNRLRQHYKEYKKDRIKSYFYNALRAHKWENFEFEILEECEEEKLSERESHWIQELQTFDREKGYNAWFRAGSRVVVSDDLREFHRQRMLAMGWKGENHPGYGKPCPEEQKEYMRRLKKKQAEDGFLPASRPVWIHNEEEEYIFMRVKEIAMHGKFGKDAIRKALNGDGICGNFKVEYADGKPTFPQKGNWAKKDGNMPDLKTNKPIKIRKDGEIKEFSSMNDAAKFLNTSRASVRRYYHAGKKKNGWEFLELEDSKYNIEQKARKNPE